MTEQTTQTTQASQTANVSSLSETVKGAADLPAELLRSEIEQATAFYQITIDFFTQYSFQLVGALIILIVGFLLSNKISKVVLRLCEKKNIDITLSLFIASTTKAVMLVLVAIVVLSKIGISITPFIAGIGAASLAAALAMQGLLANYAAGFNIIVTRPFIVGDTIEILGVTGVVKEVRLAFTIIQDEEDALITIPNKHVVGEVMLNSKKDTLLKLSVGISYNDDPVAVISLVEETLSSLEIFTNEVRIQVGIDEFADSAIVIGIRLWIPTNNMYEVKYRANKAIYLALQQANITIPFPQQDVHIVDATKLT